jgi:hypothetical protein
LGKFFATNVRRTSGAMLSVKTFPRFARNARFMCSSFMEDKGREFSGTMTSFFELAQPIFESIQLKNEPLSLFGRTIKKMQRVAIVGSGPSAYYSAKYLLEGKNELLIDFYEALPVPFGLLRYGVAPDHQEVRFVVLT